MNELMGLIISCIWRLLLLLLVVLVIMVLFLVLSTHSSLHSAKCREGGFLFVHGKFDKHNTEAPILFSGNVKRPLTPRTYPPGEPVRVLFHVLQGFLVFPMYKYSFIP